MDSKEILTGYKILLKGLGSQYWWPAKSKNKKERQFEICIGAILTQNTSWKNVEKALKNLRKEGLLNENGIKNINEKELAVLIKPAGYYNQKAKKLKSFSEFLQYYPLEKLQKMPIGEARTVLLEVHGIGKETADSILLYALSKPIFVIDTYTKRIFERLFNFKLKDYDEWQEFFEKNLEKDTQLFNEYHALIVELGKNFCKKKPLCEKCPLTLAICAHKAR